MVAIVVPMDTSPTVGTRQRLLDAALTIINRQGFSATSVDQIIQEVGVTKGAFFHHFKTKHDLARALIERFAAADNEVLHANMARAEKLARDPLQQLLVFAGLMIEVGEHLDATPEPGCLFATYCYESGLFEEHTKGVIDAAIRTWQDCLAEKLRAAAEQHPPAAGVDLDSLADTLTVVFEGAFVLARVQPGRGVFASQLRHYRNYLQLIFGAAQ